MSSEECLRIPAILQKIFGKISLDSMKYPELRLVNKRFNSEYLHRIRKTHRQIDISFDCERTAGEMSSDWLVQRCRVNWHIVYFENVLRYFKFITETAGTTVNTIHGHSYVCSMEQEFRRYIYHDIVVGLAKNQPVTSFTGFEVLCWEAYAECKQLALQCQEYGPLKYSLLRDAKWEETCHYKKLIISDSFLHQLADDAISENRTMEEAIQFIRQFITPLISCDHLEIQVYEYGRYEIDGPARFIRSFPELSEPLPRQIIEEIYEIWKPKSLGIKLIPIFNLMRAHPKWFESENFEHFHFDKPFSDIRKRKNTIDYLEIDNRNCCTSFNQINQLSRGGTTEEYSNLVANARRLFPAKEVVMKGFGNSRCYYKCIDERFFMLLMSFCWRDAVESNDWNIKLDHFASVFVKSFYELPEFFYFNNHLITLRVLPETKHWTNHQPNWGNIYQPDYDNFITKTIQLTDNTLNCIITLELHVNKADLENISKETIGNGYLKYYL